MVIFGRVWHGWARSGEAVWAGFGAVRTGKAVTRKLKGPKMAGFPKAERQKIIDDYLNETGCNLFNAGEFIDWLSGNPDHVAYPWFFAKDDVAAAREYRIGLARQMASGLRIVANVSATPEKGSVVQLTVREYPAFVSPMAGRKSGGGYQPFDPEDSAAMDELRRQGSAALRGWLARYRGAFEGADLKAIEDIASSGSAEISRSA